jgi:hypothetical protein
VEAHYAWEQTLAAMLGHYRRIVGGEPVHRAPTQHVRT